MGQSRADRSLPAGQGPGEVWCDQDPEACAESERDPGATLARASQQASGREGRGPEDGRGEERVEPQGARVRGVEPGELEQVPQARRTRALGEGAETERETQGRGGRAPGEAGEPRGSIAKRRAASCTPPSERGEDEARE